MTNWNTSRRERVRNVCVSSHTNYVYMYTNTFPTPICQAQHAGTWPIEKALNLPGPEAEVTDDQLSSMNFK